MRTTKFRLLITIAAVAGSLGIAAAATTVIPRIDGAPVRAPHQRPAIFHIDLPVRQVHSGQVVHAKVLTSSNVASVEARIKGFAVPLKHVGVGHFALNYRIPWLPPFLHGNWPVSVIARNVDGIATQKTLTVQYQ